MALRDDILHIVRTDGPILPAALTAKTGKTTIIIGAVLSELLKERLVFATHAKVGGSPLYYTGNQKSDIQMLRSHINEKDRESFDLLRDRGILKDAALSPLQKASMRQLKDFAKMMTVSINGRQEIFWKWYMLTNDEALERIRASLQPAKDTSKDVSGDATKEEKPKKQLPEERPPQKRPERLAVEPMEKPDRQQTLPEDTDSIDDPFYQDVEEFLSMKKIRVLQAEVVRAKSELAMVIQVPTPLGDIKYYARARNKKRCNDADISVAYVQAQLHNLPGVFMTTGELTKKARKLTETDFSGMAILEGMDAGGKE
ncbi:MAG: hypothetical protein ACOCWQ_01565 [Nanoarchaeota archaeon]